MVDEEFRRALDRAGNDIFLWYLLRIVHYTMASNKINRGKLIML